MADIKDKTEFIRRAQLARSVRESLASGIEAINDEVEENTDLTVVKIAEMNTLKNQLNIDEGIRDTAEKKRQTDTTEALTNLNAVVANVEDKLQKGEFVGPQGPQGIQGPQGQKGATGSIENAEAVDISTSDNSNVQAKLDTAAYVVNNVLKTASGNNLNYYTKDEIDSIPSTLKATLLNLMYPIGIILEFNKSTNPNTLLGGTWQRFGNGQVTVGVDTSQTEFNVNGKTGGSKTHLLVTDEMPSHMHKETGYGGGGSTAGPGMNLIYSGLGGLATTVNNTSAVGGGQAHNNLQPYITVYRWVRTA